MFPTKARYLPRNLGLSSTPGDNACEFLVVWKHELGYLERILEVFTRHKAKVVLTHSQLMENASMVLGTYYCDMSRADQPADSILKEIESLAFVRSVDLANTQKSGFDKFLFPVTVWGRNRVLIMRLDPLLNIEKRLGQELGSAGSAIMFREGESYATETWNQYKSALGDATLETHFENVIDGLRATGWGIFEFRNSNGGYEVTVQDPPTLDGTAEPSRFLCGVIAGILESAHSTKVKVVESAVDRKNGKLTVKLSKVSG